MNLPEIIDLMANVHGRNIRYSRELPYGVLTVAKVYEVLYRLPGTNYHPLAVSIRIDRDVDADLLKDICREYQVSIEQINGSSEFLLSDGTCWRLLIQGDTFKFWLAEAYTTTTRLKTLSVLMAYLSSTYGKGIFGDAG